MNNGDKWLTYFFSFLLNQSFFSNLNLWDKLSDLILIISYSHLSYDFGIYMYIYKKTVIFILFS
jgi:hypothetical protein